MKRIALSLMTIAVVATMAVGATSAVFNNTQIVPNSHFVMGTVKIGSITNLPLNFTNLAPNTTEPSGIVSVAYAGSLKGDLYFGFQSVHGYTDFNSYLKFQVEKVDQYGNHLGWVYTDWQDTSIPYLNWTQIASGLNENQVSNYKFYIKIGDMGNSFQGTQAYANVVFYAQQEGAVAPTGAPQNATTANN